MASPAPPGAPTWSVAVGLRHLCGLEFRAAAENVLPGWGRGGEQLSMLFRFCRRLILTVTSQCGAARPPAAAQPGTPPPRGCNCKILRFMRSRWARLPRIASVWRRKKHPPARVVAAAAAAPRGRQVQQCGTPTTRPGFLEMAQTPALVATLRFAVAAVAVVVLFRIAVLIGCWKWRVGRDGGPIGR